MYGDERGFGDPLFSQRTLLQTGDGTPGGATGIRLFKATRLMDEAGMRCPPRLLDIPLFVVGIVVRQSCSNNRRNITVLQLADR